MSASNEWTDWHLTPGGWKSGSRQLDGVQNAKIVDPPKDRVMTCRYREFLSSPFSSLEKTVSILWQSNDDKRIKELLKKYGECPRELDID